MAASIKMRKSGGPHQNVGGPRQLQCGRIYKDAEIVFYQDNEIGEIVRFNVAASIKMRKCEFMRILAVAIRSFNVAASIKMRKYPRFD